MKAAIGEGFIDTYATGKAFPPKSGGRLDRSNWFHSLENKNEAQT